jgi:hypothetical protein
MADIKDARQAAEEQLAKMVRRAKVGNGLDRYVPVEKVHGRTIAASFVVGSVMLPEEIDDLESLSMLGAWPKAENRSRSVARSGHASNESRKRIRGRM